MHYLSAAYRILPLYIDAMASFVSYQLKEGVATIRMNDGAKNLMSPQMLSELNAALDRAEQDGAVVILTGNEDVLSAGFDLKVLKKGGNKALGMLNAGFALTTRMLSFPMPIVIACNGHAIAMGVFVLLSGDYRIGVEGPYKIVANEVAIGMTMPATAIEVCKQRLAPAHFVRAVMQAELYHPVEAVQAGFFDAIVSREDLMATAQEKAAQLAQLDLQAHHKTKLRTRKQLIRRMKRANRFDKYDLMLMGLKQMMGRK